jgi:hypothetical protein
LNDLPDGGGDFVALRSGKNTQGIAHSPCLIGRTRCRGQGDFRHFPGNNGRNRQSHRDRLGRKFH